MNFDNKYFWIALIGGVVIVVFLSRSGRGDQVRTLAPLPPGDSADRAAAFSSLVDLGRAEIDYYRDLNIAQIQGVVESRRITSAERASADQSRAMIAMANIQADAQQSSDLFGFLGQIASITLPIVF